MPKPNLNSSFFDVIGQNYSDSLSIEIAELQRTIYLPLLPMEKLSIKVLQAYETLKRSYWTKDDVYTSVLGNFYIPMLFPMVENAEESTELIHKEPKNRNVKASDIGYGTEKYVTRTFVELNIPKHIVLQFDNKIPKGTTFCIGFVGGSTSLSNIKVLSVDKVADYARDEFDYIIDMAGLNQEIITERVRYDLAKIDAETRRRQKIKEDYDNARAKIVNNQQGRVRYS